MGREPYILKLLSVVSLFKHKLQKLGNSGGPLNISHRAACGLDYTRNIH